MSLSNKCIVIIIIIWSISSIHLVAMRKDNPQFWQKLDEKDFSTDGVIGLTFQAETLANVHTLWPNDVFLGIYQEVIKDVDKDLRIKCTIYSRQKTQGVSQSWELEETSTWYYVAINSVSNDTKAIINSATGYHHLVILGVISTFKKIFSPFKKSFP